METTTQTPSAARGLGPNQITILVGVNGRASGWEALDWAAAECAAWGAALRIVHVVAGAPTPFFDPFSGMVVHWRDVDDSERCAEVLGEAVRRVQWAAADVPIATRAISGSIVRSICDAGRHDDLIVLGWGKSRRRSAASTAWRVARSSSTPVAIIELKQQRAGGPSAGRVVVGINPSGGPRAAVDYAFQAAARRGTGLTAVHSSRPRVISSPWLSAPEQTATRHDLTGVRGPVRELMRRYPDVDVRYRFTEGPPAAALVDESRAAALLVIGTHARGPVGDALFGSVARSAVRGAACPVAIIGARASSTSNASR